ncbi:MAG: VIT domain-containing protein [Myxococcota bacterium]|jgi:Ca-activated chloride channel family protein|nr:VIT domain-containing protein [Myxococcota bacterium]
MSRVVFFALLTLSVALVALAQAEEEQRLSLFAKRGEELVEMPLTDIAVSAEVVGESVSVSVEQRFENPFDERLEAIYVFPLPEHAAVTDMRMLIGNRRIRATLREREEAVSIYEAAIDEGKSAALLEQERANVFTQSVGNIEPGQPISVLISYVDTIAFEDGGYRFVFPTVVGPRYVPGVEIGSSGSGRLPDTDLVVDGSRITPPVLPEGVSTAYELDFVLRIEAPVPIVTLSSPSHHPSMQWLDERTVSLSLPEDERAADRDIIIDYALSDAAPSFGLLSHHDERGGFFELSLIPPSSGAEDLAVPREMVFVLDTSGSMHGAPLDASKALVRRCLDELRPDDTFRIIRFGDESSAISESPLPATPENLSLAKTYLEQLSSGGGTDMERGVRAALEPVNEPGRMRIVLFLTDGYIGHDDTVLALVRELLRESRLFSLGVGTSVNRYLLEKLSELGRGTSFYLDEDDDPEPVVERFVKRIRRPLLTDLELDWGGLDIEKLSPYPIPDLFEGQSLRVVGRYATAGKGSVTVRGRMGGEDFEQSFDVELSAEGERPVLAQLWARRRIEAVLTNALGEGGEWSVRDEVLALSLDYGVMSQFTAMVAVDEVVSVDVADPLRSEAVAVNLPAGKSDEKMGWQIAPNYVQPGDPELSVSAPEDALSVTAYFHWGLVQSLEFDEQRQRWLSRFLVPVDVADGAYEILVVVVLPDGRSELLSLPLEVDASAPRFDLALSKAGEEPFLWVRDDVQWQDPAASVQLDEVLRIAVDVRLELAEVPTNAARLGAELLPDRIKFVRVHLPDGRSERMLTDDFERFSFDFKHRRRLGSGRFTLTIEVVDVAGNATFRSVDYEVAGESLAALTQP